MFDFTNYRDLDAFYMIDYVSRDKGDIQEITGRRYTMLQYIVAAMIVALIGIIIGFIKRK